MVTTTKYETVSELWSAVVPGLQGLSDTIKAHDR